MDRLISDWVSYCSSVQRFDASHFISLFTLNLNEETLNTLVSCCGCDSKGVFDRVVSVKEHGTLESRPYLYPLEKNKGTPDQLVTLARAELAELRKFCLLIDDEELVNIIDNVKLEYCDDKNKLDELRLRGDTPQYWIEEAVGDYIRNNMRNSNNWRGGLSEALYGLAADYYLAWYIEEPLINIAHLNFAPYFDFWKSGGEYFLTEDSFYVSSVFK